MNKITLRYGVKLFIYHEIAVSLITLSKLVEENGEIIYNGSAHNFATRSEDFYQTIAGQVEGEKNTWIDYRREFDEVDTAKDSIATALIYLNLKNPKATIIITKK